MIEATLITDLELAAVALLPIAILALFLGCPAHSWRAASQAWALAGSRYRGDRAARQLKQKVRWACLAAVHPRESLDWFDLLDAPEMRRFVERIPYLTFKPMRVYMSTKWGMARRKKVIRDTYEVIQAHRGPLRDALLEPEGAVLARFHLDGIGAASIVLCYDNGFRKEGELMASLRFDSSQGPVFTVALSLEQSSPGQWDCFIGCVQGNSRRDRDDMRTITKAMYGLRPKALMVFIAQEIAFALGATRALGVGNRIQPHRQKHLIHLPFVHDLKFDYDALWRESGGTSGPEGWFSLPLRAERRAEHDIKPNKRSMYQRRYAMLDLLAGQLQASLSNCHD